MHECVIKLNVLLCLLRECQYILLEHWVCGWYRV